MLCTLFPTPLLLNLKWKYCMWFVLHSIFSYRYFTILKLIFYEYLFLVFLLFIHTGQHRKCTSVRARRTRHQKGPRAGTLSRITQSTTTLCTRQLVLTFYQNLKKTFLLKILNAFHSMQHFSCVKNFLWLSTKLRQSYPLPPTWFLLQVPFSNCSTHSHCTNVQISCNETH